MLRIVHRCGTLLAVLVVALGVVEAAGGAGAPTASAAAEPGAFLAGPELAGPRVVWLERRGAGAALLADDGSGPARVVATFGPADGFTVAASDAGWAVVQRTDDDRVGFVKSQCCGSKNVAKSKARSGSSGASSSAFR